MLWVVMIAIGSEVERTFKDKVEIVLLLLAGYLALAAVIAFVSWYFKKYYIEGGKLVFMNGLLNKGITSIPLNKVQGNNQHTAE